jgi:gluconolactonase
MTSLRLVAVALVFGGCGGEAAQHTNPDDPLFELGKVETVGDGYLFSEGPQWRDTEGDLLIADVAAEIVYHYVPGGRPLVFRPSSGRATGLALDPAGAVIAAEQGSRSVTRDGVAIAAMFEGKRFNSPNDVIVADDGTIYFTDPTFGITQAQQELGFNGVFRIAPDGALTAELRGSPASQPNGLGLSPDGTSLYMNDTSDGNVYRFAIGAGGALAAPQVVAATAGAPDGLAIDGAGNIFVATAAGIEVFAPTGSRWGLIATTEAPTNCAFGDADHRTLYITARTVVYRVRVSHAGLPRR